MVQRRQRAQLVVGRLRVQAARQQHGAGKRVRRIFSAPRQLGLPELFVKGRVVRHHGPPAHKAGRLVHHLLGRGRGLHHLVGDARELGDERVHPHPGVHQALIAVHHLPAFEHDDRHLGGAVAHIGGDAGGFEVDDGDGGHGVKAEAQTGLRLKPAFTGLHHIKDVFNMMNLYSSDL